MKTMSWILIISMLLYSGCSSTRFIKHEQSFYDELNKTLKGKEVTITLTDGRKSLGKIIGVDPYYTSWVPSYSQKKHTVPTSEVGEIYITNHVKGALQGLLFGAIVGASTGALIIILDSSSNSDNTGSSEGSWIEGPLFTTEEIAVFCSKIFGALGALIGFLIGVNKGSTNKYFLNAPTDTTKTKKAVMVTKILKETENEILIQWGRRKVRLPKSRIKILKEKDTVTIIMDGDIYNEKIRRK